MSLHDGREREGTRRNEKLPGFRRCRVPQLTYLTPLNGAYGSLSLSFSLSYYALQPTLVPSPSVPTSPPAMQGLKDRQPYQSAGFPWKQPPPLTPALGPGALRRGPAGRAIEHAQRFHCCVSPRASRSVCELEAEEGLRRGEGAETPHWPGTGWIIKTALP